MKTYKGFDYIPFETNREMMHMVNGYVRIPKDHPYYDLVNKTVRWDVPGGHTHEHKDYDALSDKVDVHGGFTFAEQITQKDIDRGRWVQGFTPGLWVGWDYLHLGDCFYDHTDPRLVSLGIGTHIPGLTNKHWTLPEVEKECKAVIRQFIKALPN